tara:strand:- start:1052 stop:1453 length:402 start_codon:yes stop_codon:yes gene_type:complete
MVENKFNFELVTPEKILVSEEIESVCIPGVEGDMTVLPNHSAVATAIRPGYLEVKDSDKVETYFLSGGFVEISQKEVLVLAEKASLASEVSGEILTELIEKTERALEHASELQKCVLSKKLNDLTSIKEQLQK